MKIGKGRVALAAAALFALLAAAFVGARVTTHKASLGDQIAEKTIDPDSQGGADGGAGGESNDFLTAQQQFAEARTAPSGIVDPGAYSNAQSELTALPAVGGSWSDGTSVPYDADHPAYRDYYSNSSGGSGLVTGRITGLAADDAGDVWAAGADGGVWRRIAGATS